MNRFLPPPASAHAPALDAMLAHVHWVIGALFAGWALYYLYLLFRYRSGRHPNAQHRGTRGRMAILVTAGIVVAEAVMLVGSALPLWRERTGVDHAPADAVVLRVIAQQFFWNVHYPGADGQFGGTQPSLVTTENAIGLDRSSPHGSDDLLLLNELHVPIGRPVVIDLSSLDVVHSFGIPAMRVKQDATPGLRAPVWFTPTATGRFDIACSQLCGAGHYRMRGTLVVESDEAFRKFLADETAMQVRR